MKTMSGHKPFELHKTVSTYTVGDFNGICQLLFTM